MHGSPSLLLWQKEDFSRRPATEIPPDTLMRSYTVVVERCPNTGLYVGYVPGFPGAHSQAATLEELNDNLKEVIALILDDGTPTMVGEFVGTQVVVV